MRLARLTAAACIAVVLSSALSGCVVVPVPYRYGHTGYYHYYH
jgi:hypothetical protein